MWTQLPSPEGLRGRGGASFEASAGRGGDDAATATLAVVAGFAGEETNDIRIFSPSAAAWSEPASTEWLRERSVASSFALAPSSFLAGSGKVAAAAAAAAAAAGTAAGGGGGGKDTIQEKKGNDNDERVVVVFGGEVDPSSKGHEGAGSFANDVVAVRARSGAEVLVDVKASESTQALPQARGWADGAALNDSLGVVFGGLTGDDANPVRLGDTWFLRVQYIQ